MSIGKVKKNNGINEVAWRKSRVTDHNLMPRGVLFGKIAHPKAEHRSDGNRRPQFANMADEEKQWDVAWRKSRVRFHAEPGRGRVHGVGLHTLRRGCDRPANREGRQG